MAMPSLAHAQSGSARRAQVREESRVEETSLPPPASRLDQRTSMDPRKRMPPPPTPQLASGSRLLPARPSFLPPGTPQLSSSASQRFVLQTPSKATTTGGLATPRAAFNYGQQQNSQTQRFIPGMQPSGMASGSGSGAVARSGSVAQTPSRAGSFAVGGQRTPFIPSADGGFS